MLAIVRALEDWHHYLEGLPSPFEIISDHRNLQYWRTIQDLTCRQARWFLYLSRFDFHLTHKPSPTNTQADPLSCLSTHLVADADDNRNQLVLRPEHFSHVIATSNAFEDPLDQRIKNVMDCDP